MCLKDISVIQDLPSSQNTVTAELESPPENTLQTVIDKVLNDGDDLDGINAFLVKAKSMPRRKN